MVLVPVRARPVARPRVRVPRPGVVCVWGFCFELLNVSRAPSVAERAAELPGRGEAFALAAPLRARAARCGATPLRARSPLSVRVGELGRAAATLLSRAMRARGRRWGVRAAQQGAGC